MNYIDTNTFFSTKKKIDNVIINRVNIIVFFQLLLIIEALDRDITNTNLMLEFVRLTTNIKCPKQKHLKYYSSAYDFNIPKIPTQFESKKKSISQEYKTSSSIIQIVEIIAAEHSTPISDILNQYNIFQVLILLDCVEKRHCIYNADLVAVIAGANSNPSKTMKSFLNRAQGIVVTKMSLADAIEQYGKKGEKNG